MTTKTLDSTDATVRPETGPAHKSAAAYRADIDGLRAIAVTTVVLFHAAATLLPGGFTGVDIFFVISGYLIGGQIFSEAEAGVFSYGSFYARRARRILPALYALLAIIYLAASLLFTPLETRQLGKEAVATVLGLSNALYYGGQGYFAPHSNPLLMTWSLGVEEQFYVLFPIVALGLLKFRHIPALRAIAALSAISFLASIALSHLDQKAAFYLLPTRGWELGLGAMLALSERHGLGFNLPRWLIEAGAALSIGAIALGMVLYRPSYEFPGVYALLPTLGALGLLATRRSAFNRWVLSCPPLRFVGWISYSWYLWHWPIFYLNEVLGEGRSRVSPLLLVGVSFLIACASWAVVEQHFRKRVAERGVVLRRYLAVGAVLATAGLAFFLSYGWPQRFPALSSFLQASRDVWESPCLARDGAQAPVDSPACLPALPAAGTHRVLVLGDSHANAIAPGVKAVAGEAGSAFGEMTKSSCPPLWGYAPANDPGARCRAFQSAAFTYVRNHPEVRTVVLGCYWSASPDVRGDHGDVALEAALADTVTRLQALGRTVVLVQDTPLLGFDPYARTVGDMMPARAALVRLLGAGRPTGRYIANADELLPDPTRVILARVAESHPGVTVLDPASRLCNAAGCRFRDAGAIYYTDFQHLTAQGAMQAVRGFHLSDEI